MLNQLKHLDLDRLDLEQALALSAFATSLIAEYQRHEIDPPEWLNSRCKELLREIRTRQADQLERRLAAARQRLNSLRTPEEKREATQQEIEALEQALDRE